MKWELPEIPKYKVPDELKIYREGACFMIVRKDKSDPDSELVFIHAYNAAMEKKEEKIVIQSRETGKTAKVIQRALVVLAAKILDGVGAGLPSCYYESMETKSLDEIAEIAINRIKNTKVTE